MKRHLFASMFAAVSVAACTQASSSPEAQEIVEEHPDTTQSALYRDPSPTNICFGTCPRTPDFEPLGQICWLDRQACLNGILTCYYHCEAVEASLTRY